MPAPTPDEFQSLLATARTRFFDEELAEELDVSVRTIERWQQGRASSVHATVGRALRDLLREEPSRVVPIRRGDFTFIDLFAGIGGTRLGFELAGGDCVFTSEYDRWCQMTYRANFRPAHRIAGDIREVTRSPELIHQHIPDHDVLVAGFPCQPFSLAGVSKKNSLGRAHGFDCEAQGTLFFDIWKILETKRPAAFLLENVRNLRSHDGGRTFRVIMEELAKLEYVLPEPRVIDARHWVPQHRERIFIAGFRRPTPFTFDMVSVPETPAPTMAHVLHPEDGSEAADGRFTVGPKGQVDRRYTLTPHLWDYLQRYREKHEAAGHGFGFSTVTRDDVARTLSARYHKDGSEILVSRGPRRTPRRLTPRECARLMGFPEHFRIPKQVSDTQAYRQFGNSVVVPVIEAIAQAMKPYVISLRQDNESQLAMVV